MPASHRTPTQGFAGVGRGGQERRFKMIDALPGTVDGYNSLEFFCMLLSCYYYTGISYEGEVAVTTTQGEGQRPIITQSHILVASEYEREHLKNKNISQKKFLSFFVVIKTHHASAAHPTKLGRTYCRSRVDCVRYAWLG